MTFTRMWVCVWDWQGGDLSDLAFLSADRSQLLPLLPTRKGRLYSQILIYALPPSNFYLGAPCWTHISSGSLFMNLLKGWFGVIHWLVTFYWKRNGQMTFDLFPHLSHFYAFLKMLTHLLFCSSVFIMRFGCWKRHKSIRSITGEFSSSSFN